MKELIEAVILVGGLGTRLQTVVSDRPKVLAVVNGKPFLEYLLDQVAAVGIKHTVLCVGYRAEQVQATFGDVYAGMHLDYSQETTLLGTGGALRLALSMISSDKFIAMNGDSFCDINLMDLWEWHHARPAGATLVLTSRLDTARYGRVSLSAGGLINGFEEKDNTEGEGWVNAGVYVLDSEMVRAIPLGCVVSLEREIFPDWVRQRCLYGYQCLGRFLDIGTPESYAQADDLFSAGKK